jgi:hypothetical protein
MTADLDRRLQVGQDYKTMATTTIGNRFPLQSRFHGGGFDSASPSAAAADGCALSGNGRVMNRLSTLESSNNENNKAQIASFSQHRGRQGATGAAIGGPERDASTLAQVGAPTSSLGSAPNSHQKRSESVGRGRPSSKPTTTQPRSASQAPRASSKGVDDSNNSDNENVIIEEKRRRVNGEGYTVHRYLRGRLLGRGGFAKVYLCTALDTSKNYAVKIVPKANLVKARARQKVNSIKVVLFCALLVVYRVRASNSYYSIFPSLD